MMEQKRRNGRNKTHGKRYSGRRNHGKWRGGLLGMAVAGAVLLIGGSVFLAIETEKRIEARTKQAKKAERLVVTAEDIKAPVVPDRSDFAVKPGRTVGTTEQSAEKTVYLTLDDGPSNLTAQVLEILDQYNVKATFFVTNAMPEYRHMIKEAYDRGHTIGLHTYSHDYASIYSSTQAYMQDLEKIGQVVKEQIGYVPSFIRFPGGASNTISANYCTGIMSAVSGQVLAQGYQYYDWNCSSGDGSVRNADELTAQATSCAENNIILLSHDSAAKATTVEALPRIIAHYQSQGYVFKAIDTTSYVVHHGIGN